MIHKLDSGKDMNIESWLSQIALSKSGSWQTERTYRRIIAQFFQYIGKTSEQILTENETLPEKTFKRFYATAINSFVL